MKKLALVMLLAMMVSVAVAAGGRHSDRNWSFTSVTLNAGSKRVTNTQSGMLYIENNGADAYMSFDATANTISYDKYMPDGSGTDFYPASITYGDYFTIVSSGNTTITYVVLD